MRVDEPPPGEELNNGEVTERARGRVADPAARLAEGPEVLLVQRNPEQRFMGGAWVFPGGSTSKDDGDELRTAAPRARGGGRHRARRTTTELVRFSRWITPAQVKVRFDTQFFVARAPDGAEAEVDGGECVDSRWVTPAGRARRRASATS